MYVSTIIHKISKGFRATKKIILTVFDVFPYKQREKKEKEKERKV